MTIKAGSIVRYSDSFCERVRADDDTARDMARVIAIVPKLGSRPAYARLHWQDGRRSAAFLPNLEEWRGGTSLEARREWGILAD